MPNLDSAKKELRKSKRNRAYNDKVRIDLKDIMKKARRAVESKDEKSVELVRAAMKMLDKAAQKGVIKKNTGSRKKSRLSIKLNATLKK